MHLTSKTSFECQMWIEVTTEKSFFVAYAHTVYRR